MNYGDFEFEYEWDFLNDFLEQTGKKYRFYKEEFEELLGDDYSRQGIVVSGKQEIEPIVSGQIGDYGDERTYETVEGYWQYGEQLISFFVNGEVVEEFTIYFEGEMNEFNEIDFDREFYIEVQDELLKRIEEKNLQKIDVEEQIEINTGKHKIKLCKNGKDFEIKEQKVIFDDEEIDMSDKPGMFVQKLIDSDDYNEVVQKMEENDISVDDVKNTLKNDKHGLQEWLLDNDLFEELKQLLEDDMEELKELFLDYQEDFIDDVLSEWLETIEDDFDQLREMLVNQDEDFESEEGKFGLVTEEVNYKEIEVTDGELRKEKLKKIFGDNKVRVFPLSELKVQNDQIKTKKQKDLIQNKKHWKQYKKMVVDIPTQDEIEKQNEKLEDTQKKIEKSEIKTDMMVQDEQVLIDLSKILKI